MTRAQHNGDAPNLKGSIMETDKTAGIRRVVTGHDPNGSAKFLVDDRTVPSGVGRGDAKFALIWTTPTVPADNNDDTDGATRAAGLTLHGGSVIRVVDMAPGQASPMHRSNSIDYGIVLDGAIELELEGGATTKLGPGNIIVQRGTNHLWRNPSATEWCRIVFVLIEAAPVRIGGVDLPEIHP
jgi:quercetin dioxygenase-like cupin family protein